VDGKAITDTRRKSYYNKIVRDCGLVKGFDGSFSTVMLFINILRRSNVSIPLSKPPNPDSFVVVSEP